MNDFPNLKNPIHFIATLGAIGKLPFAPGTWGSLFACILFIFLSHFVSQIEILVIVTIFFSIWICEKASSELIEKDHKSIVIDELAGMWLAVYPAIFYNTQDERVIFAILAFCFFRVFDIFKPPPISWVDKNIKGGFGIMMDDMLAAGFTLFSITLFLKAYNLDF